jgi:hypothetical protein
MWNQYAPQPQRPSNHQAVRVMSNANACFRRGGFSQSEGAELTDLQ